MRHYLEVSDANLSSGPHPKQIVIDLETTGLNPRKDCIVGIAFAIDGKTGYFTRNFEQLREILANSETAKIFHNATFDLSFLKAKGFMVKGPIHDTMLLAHLHDPDRKSHSLKEIAKAVLGEESIAGAQQMRAWLESQGFGREHITKAPPEVLLKYAAEDALNTWDLFQFFTQKLDTISAWLRERSFTQTPVDYYKNEVAPLIEVVTDMQLRGIKLDLEETAKTSHRLTTRINQISAELNQELREDLQKAEALLVQKKIAAKLAKSKTGKLNKIPTVLFNWDSNDHLKTLFFSVYKEKPKKTTATGQASADAETLENFAPKYSWITKLLEYKTLQKLANTYLDNLLTFQEGGYIHANFNLAGTATGRFSSSGPNMQNLPKQGGIKKLFIPDKDNIFVYSDYSQLELRIAAHLSQDQLLLRAYRDGLDLHQETADLLGVDRSMGKTINFAIIYDASGWRVAEILGWMGGIEEDNFEEKKAIARRGDAVVKQLFSKYTGLKKFLDKQAQLMQEYGMVISEFGMVRRLPGLKSQDRKQRTHAFKAGFNMPIQSFGASLCKRAMIKLSESYTIINQVHDSIVIESPKSANVIDSVKEIMENIYSLSVPLVVEPKLLSSLEEKDLC